MSASPHTPQLLLVDDEPDVLHALQRVFWDCDYDITTAEGGLAGLDLLTQQDFDLIISDMRMPEMDGAEFLSAAAEFAPDTVRFLLTGYAEHEATVRAVNHGKIATYLNKPWNNEELKRKVEDALKLKEKMDERRQLLQELKWLNRELDGANQELRDSLRFSEQELEQTADFLELAYEELRQSYDMTIRVFARLVGSRLGVHAQAGNAVAQDVLRFCPFLLLDASGSQTICQAAQLHQLGKIVLPDRVLQQPYDHLNEAERKLYQGHPLHAEAILMAITPLQAAAQLIRHQMEQFDGQGLPDRLRGVEIPLGARILKIAGDYQAYRHGLLTGRPIPADEARAMLQAGAGKQYDPVLLRDFLSFLQESEGADDQPRHAQPLAVGDLQPGMELAADLCRADGILLLARGTVLNGALLARLAEIDAGAERPLVAHVSLQ